MSRYDEASFEEAIEVFLTSDKGGYRERSYTEFNREVCLDSEVFIEFVKQTQPEAWAYLEKFHKEDTEKVLIGDLTRALDSPHEGALNVLRHGFKCYGKLFHAAYFKPASGLNPKTQQLYDGNILTITRQARYSTQHENSVDVVLTVNGIPVVTMELKNPLTGQTWRHAVHQYSYSRDSNETLFAFKRRAAVHFAVDTDEAHMTTKLDGGNTSFLPFNKGHGYGAGNPENPDGYKTAYLWEEVLERDSLLEIIARFLHVQKEEKKVGNKTVTREKMIFPRYHQLVSVRGLLKAAEEEGAGENYLIQHSAGSGKSNSIAWVAHRLASLHNSNDEKVFHSVVVVTDRLVLDQQLQNTIYEFEHKAGVVNKIERDSSELAEALNTGSPIIITTLQKFPFVLDKVGNVQNRRYAVIVDEAHSSMGGETATEMTGVLGAKGSEDKEEPGTFPDEQEEILKAMNRRGAQPNISFFAFTATPKYKTLEVFGRPDEEGKPEPFHLYSMRQAIEEGFILDVLQNYTSYTTYFKLIKSTEDDPQVDKRKTAAALARFVSLHPYNIAQKTEVIVEHFRHHTRHRIAGLAKAMVVTRSRLHAVRYKQAIDKYIHEQGYTDLRTLVAFSGTVVDPESYQEFTEVGMNNGIREKEVPEKFASKDYSVLIVAEKYQTGFDQPLLHTMYVDRRLGGIQAIQTLSRLNRICPGKEETFVLDFVNSEEDIQEAFKPYYEKTIVGEQVDHKKLYELEGKLAEFRVYYPQEVEEYAKVFFAPKKAHSKADGAKMNSILDTAVSRFKELSEDQQEEFRSSVVAFKNLYAFLAQIIPFQDSDLEKVYTFLKFLHLKLPARGQGDSIDLGGEVALKYYRLQKESEGRIQLSKSEQTPLDGPQDVGSSGSEATEVELSKLIEVLNEKFKTDFTEADELFFESVQADASRDQTVRDAALANTMDNFKYVLDRRLSDLFVERMDQNESITSRFLNDEEFKDAITEMLVKRVYEQVREEAGV